MENISACLGRNVKTLRQKKNLTQGQLAAKAGLSVTFLQNIEAGRRWVGPSTIALLASALGVPECGLFAPPRPEPERLEPAAVLAYLAEALGVDVRPPRRRPPSTKPPEP